MTANEATRARHDDHITIAHRKSLRLIGLALNAPLRCES
jgi:hypothetical protein